MTLLGVDYSTGPLPGATARANGLSFVCRYVSTPSNSKNLKASEVADLSANGIGIVVVFENDPLVGTPMPLRGNAQRTGPAHRQRVDLLAAAGCRGSGGRQMTVHFNGVDFAYGNGVTADQLKAAGVQFVCRYLSDDSSKDISAEELANYKAAGIAVVLNWESTGEMPDEAQGMADAHGAQAEAEAPRPVDELHNLHSAPVVVAIAVRKADCGGQKTLGLIEADGGCADASELREIADTHDLDLQVARRCRIAALRTRRFTCPSKLSFWCRVSVAMGPFGDEPSWRSATIAIASWATRSPTTL